MIAVWFHSAELSSSISMVEGEAGSVNTLLRMTRSRSQPLLVPDFDWLVTLRTNICPARAMARPNPSSCGGWLRDGALTRVAATGYDLWRARCSEPRGNGHAAEIEPRLGAEPLGLCWERRSTPAPGGGRERAPTAAQARARVAPRRRPGANTGSSSPARSAHPKSRGTWHARGIASASRSGCRGSACTASVTGSAHCLLRGAFIRVWRWSSCDTASSTSPWRSTDTSRPLWRGKRCGKSTVRSVPGSFGRHVGRQT